MESDARAARDEDLASDNKTQADYLVNRDRVWDRPLSPRESEVLCYIATGFTDAEIADVLALSTMTVSTHVKRLLRKLGVGRRSAAVALALKHELILARDRSARA